MDSTRRDTLSSAAAMLAMSTGFGALPGRAFSKELATMSETLAPSILPYLADLEAASHQIANTWRPDDPAYRADVYRQIMMNLSYAYFAYFHADPEHPDWAPLWNPVYLLQPNPDDIYLYCPLRGDLKYRVSGNAGTVKLLTFTTQRGAVGMSDEIPGVDRSHDFDQRDLEVGPDGEFEVLISAERPAGHAGNWGQMDPLADALVVRYCSSDWLNQRDPQLSVECLDKVPPKARLSPDEIVQRLRETARFPLRMTKLFFPWQNDIKAKAGVNVFIPGKIQGGLSKQMYWPCVFELEDGEALIIETDMPKRVFYWNIQLNDPYFNAIEFVYRPSSLNESTGRVSSDGKLRAIIALEDPGVPNWLDPAGFKQGTVYGRWYDADSYPTPVIKRVKLAELRQHLPQDTPVVTPEQRAEEIRIRIRGAQRRRRW
jgi:hypothetical protein